jgi:RNA polymerase sigma-70 factor (ECF subfamily)
VPLTLAAAFVERARSGGSDLEDLIAAVWPEAYRIAFAILRDAGLAEDAAQEACATVARSLQTLRNADFFSSWSYKIIVNEALTTARRRLPTEALSAAEESIVNFDCSDALDLYDALTALPLEQRAAILLYYYAGLNSGEIAEATGVASSTVRFHLMLARRTLRKALSTESHAAPAPEEILPHVR